jgi:tRNA uridine 5-carboxymethylaminomethyl modification enzyme
MEHKLNESEKWWFLQRNECLVAELPILESKDTALITQGDKMFKVFSRPQIDLEDIMNLKGCSVCGRK